MAKRTQRKQKPQTTLQEFVAVAFTEDTERAKDYATLLKANDIPVTIREQHEQLVNGKNLAVMVPEEFLDEAHVIIESQDAYDDFYDLTLEEDDDDCDIDLFGDEF